MDIVDVEFAIMDVEGQLRDVALALAAKGKKQSFLYFLLPPDQLSLFTPENLLKLQRIHLSRLQARLAPDSAWAPQPERNRLLAWRSGKVRLLAPGSASAPPKPDIDPSLQDSNASASVAPALVKDSRGGGCGATWPMPAPNPTIHPRPPCSHGYQRKTVVVSMDAVWRFLVKHSHETFKSDIGNMNRVDMLKACEAATGVCYHTVKHYKYNKKKSSHGSRFSQQRIWGLS